MIDPNMESVPFPGRKIAFVFEHDTIGDGFFTGMLYEAVKQFSEADKRGELDEFTASNGVNIKVTWPRYRTLEEFDADVEAYRNKLRLEGEK